MVSCWLKGALASAALALLAGAPVAAQEALKLKAGESWKHKHSGIVVPATLGATPRAGGAAYAVDDLDVGLSYTVGDAAESLTFYIFRNTNGGVPVWFSQAQWAIENRGSYGKPTASLAPQAFTPPGQTAASGLKAVYAPTSGSYRSTGVMLMPVGDWYVKLRASSQSRTPAELAHWMDAALAEVEWPKAIAAAPEAVPVTDCPAPLAFPDQAEDAPKNGGADLIAGVLGMAVGQGTVKPTPESAAEAASTRWCRDSWPGVNQGVYRRNADTANYLLAVGDNGNGIWVGPDASAALLAEGEKGPRPATRYSIMLMMAAQNINFVAQDRLPSPQRVMAIVNGNRSVTTVPTWGKNREVRVNSSNF